MNRERQEESAALHALDLFEASERSAFEREMAADHQLGLLAAQFRRIVGALALSAPQVAPPASLKDSILASLPPRASSEQTNVPAGEAEDDLADEEPTVPFARFLPWAAAALFAVSTLWFAAQSYSLRTENQALQIQRDLAETACRIAESQLAERSLLAEQMINDLGTRLRRSEDLTRLRIASLAALAGGANPAQAVAVWDGEQQSGLLTAENLPGLRSDQDYQLWVIDPQYPIPVDGGVFRPDPEGRVTLAFRGDRPIQAVSAFAVSLERKGGVPKAEGPMVLISKR